MSFVVVKPVRSRHAPLIVHHPSCVHVWRATTGEVVLFPPPNSVLCNVCKGKEFISMKVRTQVLEDERKKRAKGRTSTIKPKGRYRIVVMGRRNVLAPCECPRCGSENVEHQGRRLWACWDCPWMGGVDRTTWTRLLDNEL